MNIINLQLESDESESYIREYLDDFVEDIGCKLLSISITPVPTHRVTIEIPTSPTENEWLTLIKHNDIESVETGSERAFIHLRPIISSSVSEALNKSAGVVVECIPKSILGNCVIYIDGTKYANRPVW
jgi:hypothetical protein